MDNMNIEMANRLVQLRRKNGFSQEELAARLGISRQAVSKWERAEASPDTDNLIALARLYGVSLDELLFAAGETEGDASAPTDRPPPEEVYIGLDRIHVVDGGERVDIGQDGIYVQEGPGGDEVQIDAGGVRVNGQPLWSRQNFWHAFPYPVLTVIVFLLLGFLGGWWHPGWIVFLTIPVYYMIVEAAEKKKPLLDGAYPVLMAIVYLLLGFCGGWWHPGWIVFLTIPLYYGISHTLKDGDRT